jgi:UDP-N-acetylglucosamine 2-epimerase (non-hydrolysing)
MSTLRPLLVFGTRPEAIKMAPIVLECLRRGEECRPIVCTTGQHREMLAQVVDHFQLPVDDCLDLMVENQTLAKLTARCVESLDQVLQTRQPDCVVAQGDTTTVMAASLAAFYHRIPFVHVEAGLRTGNLQSPWPEEANRRLVSVLAALHCAPTQRAAETLRNEGVAATDVRVTGNTVIDALLDTVSRQQLNGRQFQDKYGGLRTADVVLITGHRRENFGQGFEDICQAIASLAERFRDCHFVYPVHLNPNVQQPVKQHLGHLDNVHLIPPVSYPEFVWLMKRAKLILTDSGGVQEEAPSLGKPVLVMRETTERPEAVEAGAARLVGTSTSAIVDATACLLSDSGEYAACQVSHNPYGDGEAGKRIVDWMLERFGKA